MPIKNYTSSVSPQQSMGNIQAVLSEHGAQRIQIDYDGGKPQSITFAIPVSGRLVAFKLTVNPLAMLKAMENDPKVPKSYCNLDQAERTAWKNKLEWLQLQIAEIEAEQAKLEQLLLGYAVTDTGETAFERLKHENYLLSE